MFYDFYLSLFFNLVFFYICEFNEIIYEGVYFFIYQLKEFGVYVLILEVSDSVNNLVYVRCFVIYDLIFIVMLDKYFQVCVICYNLQKVEW